MRGIVVAHDKNRVIGRQGELPWGRSMPRDMRRFRDITLGSPIIMGRLTYESIGRPLPDRKNVIISQTLGQLPGITVVGSLDEAFDVTAQDEHVYVVGGARIYELALPKVDVLYVTRIDTEVEDGDTFFVDVNEVEWNLETEDFIPRDSENQFDCAFLTYRRSRFNANE